MKPTEAQIKEFWEWCEVKPLRLLHNFTFLGIKSIDLNNLFKYAPLEAKADLHINFHEVHWVNGKVFTECSINSDNDEIGKGFVEGILKDVAYLALFWALREVKERGNGE